MTANLANKRTLGAALAVASALALSAMPTPAAADAFFFDWRSNDFAAIAAPNPNLSSFSFTWAGNPSQGIDPVTVTIAGYRQASNGTRYARPLWWDSTDGIGVDSTGYTQASYEPDEVEGNERLVFSFSRAIEIDQILISDLFPNEVRSGQSYNERGYFQIDNGPTYEFQAGPGGVGTINYPGGQLTDGVPPTFQAASVNGEWAIILPQPTMVTSLTFSAPGLVTASTCVSYWHGQCNCYDNYTQDHDFSLVGVNFQFNTPPENVPEPAPLALLGLGVIGLGILRHRRSAA